MQLRALLVALLFPSAAFGVCSGVSPTWSCPLDANAVSLKNLLNGTQAGLQRNTDTINIGSGSITVSSSINVTVGVKLIGAGAGSTVMTSSGGVALITVNPDPTALANSEKVTINSMTLDGALSSLNLITVAGTGSSASLPYKSIIIGPNITLQKNNNVTSSGNGVILLTGQVRGAITAHFSLCNQIIKYDGNDDLTEWNNTAFNQFAYGSANAGDNLYLEHSTIDYPSAYTDSTGNAGWIETGQGGRIVTRYNTWDLTNVTTSAHSYWDVHGFQNGPTWPPGGSGQTGTMIVEYYGNTIVGPPAGSFEWMNHRASWALMFNNIATNETGMGIDLYAETATSACPTLSSPFPGYVNNSYFFNNTVNGSQKDAAIGSFVPACVTGVNVNWWNQDATCTSSACSTGIGRGTTAPTGTCTAGTGYWVASTATPTVSSSVIQNATFYKCTSTNVWTAYYQPYTDPNPLFSSSTVGVTLTGGISLKAGVSAGKP